MTIDHRRCIEELEGAIGMDYSRLEPLGGGMPGGGAGAAGLDMSMAEAFVSMINDDLTVVTQLEIESPAVDLETPITGTLSPSTQISLATPTALDHHSHINSATTLSPSTPASFATPTTLARCNYASPMSKLAMATTPINATTTPITPKTSSKLAMAATPINTSTIQVDNSSSPPLNDSKPLNHHNLSPKKNGFQTPRMELFPEADTVKKCAFDLSTMNLSDDDYMGETILLTDEEVGLSINGSISSGCLTENKQASQISSNKQTGDNKESPSSPAQAIPEWILRMTNEELKEKLVSLGEQPGPINGATRSAYQLYLSKIQEGIQPTGNKGYKGMSL